MASNFINPDADFWDDTILKGGTVAQCQAVKADGVEYNGGVIPVGAGAGTGKTWVLAQRFARLLLTAPEQLLPRDILTLTFTDKAANEMKERIIKRLKTLARDARGKGSPLAPEREKSLIDGFAEAWISTIHSFAKRLVGESGLSLDIDPHADVINNEQTESFWHDVSQAVELGSMATLARTWNYALLDDAKALDTDPVLAYAVGCWGAEKLADLARDATELHASNGATWREMREWAKAASLGVTDELLRKTTETVLEGMLKPEWRSVWEQWRAVFDDLGDMIQAEGKKSDSESARGKLLDFYLRWADKNVGDATADLEEQRKFYLETMESIKGDGSKMLKKLKDSCYLGQLLGDWQKAHDKKKLVEISRYSSNVDEPLSDSERKLRASLLNFCAVCWGLWDSMKHKRGVMNFADMILNAHRALEQSLEQNRVTRKFQHILVDEFQDTDPLQFNMIRLVAKASSDYLSNSISPAREARGNVALFAVGDPKQSIYGFRHADPALFADMLSKTGQVSNINLDVNFRTRKDLLRRLNQLFAYVWSNGIGGSEIMQRIKFEPLNPPDEPFERTSEMPAAFSMIFSVCDSNNHVGRPEALKHLAREIARQCREWVTQGKKVKSKKTGELRPLEYGDIAILVRKRNVYDLLEDAFEKEGVATLEDTNRSYFSRSEVGDVVALLRAAANLDDDTALAGWLFSPFASDKLLTGLSLEDAVACLEQLAESRDRDETKSLIDILDERLPEVAERIRQLSFIGQQSGPSKLLEEIDKDRRWLNACAPKKRLRVLRNVQRGLSLAREFDSGDSSSLTACADWMERVWRKEMSLEEASWSEASDDTEGGPAVRFLTIHASKGLEFPIVVLFDSSQRNARMASLKPSRQLGIAFSKIPDELADLNPDSSGTGTRNMALEKLLTEQAEKDEDMRLFYVAATRARDSLLFCGLVNQTKTKGLTAKTNFWTSHVIDWLKDRGECDDELNGLGDMTGAIRLIDSAVFDSPNSTVDSTVELETMELEELKKPEFLSSANIQTLGLPVARPNCDGVRLSSMSATSFSLYEWCPLAWRRRYKQGLNLTWEMPSDWGESASLDVADESESGNDRGGADLGSLAHWLLAQWKPTTSELSVFADRWLGNEDFVASHRRHLPAYLRDTYQDKANRETLKDWLIIFAESDAGAELRAALLAGAEQEANFALNISSESASAVKITGAMDVVWHDNDVWNVLDYKITAMEHAPRELYNAQLDFYALAVREGTLLRNIPCSSVNVKLVFLREGGSIEQWHVGNWDSIRERVLNVARDAALGVHGPRREHCARCPWRMGCGGSI